MNNVIDKIKTYNNQKLENVSLSLNAFVLMKLDFEVFGSRPGDNGLKVEKNFKSKKSGKIKLEIHSGTS